jgi:secondary thiamine-phosphate synthase enzyme
MVDGTKNPAAARIGRQLTDDFFCDPGSNRRVLLGRQPANSDQHQQRSCGEKEFHSSSSQKIWIKVYKKQIDPEPRWCWSRPCTSPPKLTFNDNEEGLIADIDQWLEGLAPFRKDYQHHETGEDNGDSHLKALLVHHQVIVPVSKSRLVLGTWQRIFYAEFDGQRSKRLLVYVMGE